MKTSTTPSLAKPRSRLVKSKKKTSYVSQEILDHAHGPEVLEMGYVHEIAQAYHGISHHDIARLAQRIYEEEGCPANRAEAHWFEAERRLREEDRRRSQILPYAVR